LAINRRNVIAVAATVAVLYVLADGGYRIYQHRELERDALRHMAYNFSSVEAPLYALDEGVGYSYRANLRLHFRLYDRQGNLVRENQLVSNNFGHLELEDDSLEKPDSEFRIAVLADSFAATTTSDVTWPTYLQQELNRDPKVKTITGKSAFKVINFGLDGTGFIQWPGLYEKRAKSFRPDLVIVSFIGNDIYRRWIYRDTINIGNQDQVMITCTSLPVAIENADCLNAYSFVVDPNKSDYRQQTARIRRELFERTVERMPWTSPAPELLLLLFNGRWGIQPRLMFPDRSMSYFTSSQEALSVSQKALRNITSQQPAIIILYHPTIEECLTNEPPPAVREMMKRERSIENMLDFLPLASGPKEIQKWYNLPYDSHPSDYGAQVYARAVEGRVAQHLSTSRLSARVAP